VEFRILGPLEVADGERRVALGSSRQRTLLALLLTHANEVVSVDRLIDELWGSEPPNGASNALQYHVSQLRKALAPADAIVTQDPGYLIRVQGSELDLLRFEQLVADAHRAGPDRAVALLTEALGLWRGQALADLANEPFAQAEIARLEELRLAALELRVEAELALGRHARLVGDLERLVRTHPLRERLRGQLMRALYGADRQADALAVYRDTRKLLVDELGIEPSASLQELEKAILEHDPSLKPGGAAVAAAAQPLQQAIVVVVRDDARASDLLSIAEPLAHGTERELILVRLLTPDADVTGATAALTAQREALAGRGVSVRVAAYTSTEAAADAALLASDNDAVLALVDGSSRMLESGVLDEELRLLLADVPCDVGVLVGGAARADGPVVTPFGGIEHDWAAIEIAAWFARALETTLRLVGTRAEPEAGRRDASRLLARASLLVQQVVGIATEPALVPPGAEGVLDASQDARVLVVGFSERWRSEGLGDVRAAVASRAGVPTLFVRRGVRPSGVAPRDTLTRFTWTIASARTS
jgi:DNA-binding SARP family transcriptional activator